MPSKLNKRAVLGILAGFSIVVIVYSLIIAQQILLGLIVAIAPWLLYLVVRFIFTLERIATALEQLASVRAQEQESAGSAGDYQRPSDSYEHGKEPEGGVENE